MSNLDEQQKVDEEKGDSLDDDEEENKLQSSKASDITDEESIDDEKERNENIGLTKAITAYKKIIETDDLTEEQKTELEKKLREIEEREIIEDETVHEPKELPSENKKILIGPPTLTRFEKARIMGARALQLSLGAPSFINIPKTAKTSLDIAMEELDKRAVPIVIRRILPNSVYQNIPIDFFKY